MKITHWCKPNGSGMYAVALMLVAGETNLGIISRVEDPFAPVSDEILKAIEGTNVHVVHTHIPNKWLYDSKTPKLFVSHATPEVMFTSALREAERAAYGHSDPLMLLMWWLQHADAVVSLVERHQQILLQMSDRGRQIYYVPLGVDTSFWKPVPSAGKYDGTPSLFSAENQYEIKSHLDTFLALPTIVSHSDLHATKFHAIYVPTDQSRVLFPLADRCGAAFSAHISAKRFGPEDLRNAFCSIDFYLNLVRYGDPSLTGLQARACGVPLISYAGNPYADYWVSEGDQRVMAVKLIDILTKTVEPRTVSLVPTATSMVGKFVEIYRELGAS